MTNLSIFVCFALSAISIQLVSAKSVGTANADGQFEIRAGNCSVAVPSNLVFEKHVHLLRFPLVSRSDKPSWYGDPKIYCILALSKKEKEKGSTVAIIEGGLNHTYITFELKSAINHGLEYNLSVYAK